MHGVLQCPILCSMSYMYQMCMCYLLSGDYPVPTQGMVEDIYRPVGEMEMVQHIGCGARRIRDCTLHRVANQFVLFMQHCLRDFTDS